MVVVVDPQRVLVELQQTFGTVIFIFYPETFGVVLVALIDDQDSFVAGIPCPAGACRGLSTEVLA